MPYLLTWAPCYTYKNIDPVLLTRVYNVSLSLFTWALNNLLVLFTWTFNKPFLFSVQCANPVTKLYEAFRGNLRWLYSLTKYSLLQLSRPVLTLVSVFSASLHVSFSVDRTYRLDSPSVMQGLSIPFACVGSGDPVRVLHLYTTNTLDIL